MTCRAAARARARDAAESLQPQRGVEGVEVLAPGREDNPTDRWALDVALGPASGGLIPSHSALLADYGLTVRSVAPRGAGWHALAVVSL